MLAAINRDENTAADYDHARSLPLVTLKMVGYLEVVHALLPRISPDGSIVIFGGLAKDPAVPGLFLLENRSVNAANLPVDGGTLLR